MNKKTMIMGVLSVLAVSSLAACANTQNALVDDVVDDEFYRITMGNGHADKTEQYLYVSDFTYVYEMDLETYEVLPLQGIQGASYLNIVGDTIYYVPAWGEGARRYDFNEQTSESLYTESYLVDLYATEQFTYGLIGRDSVLVRIDNETGEYEELLDGQNLMYAKYGDDIYYITRPDSEDVDSNATQLWCLNENTGEKKQIDIGMHPNSLTVYNGKIYMSECYTWDFYEYDMKTEELRKIEGIKNTYNFCCCGDWLYYLGESEEGIPVLMRYSLKTEEQHQILEEVVDFTVFSDGTLVVQLYEEGYTFVNYYMEYRESDRVWIRARVLPEEIVEETEE